MAADREFEERPLTDDDYRELDRQRADEFADRYARPRREEGADG